MITSVAAISANGKIGNKGTIPWHIPEDMARYKQLTMGKVIIMGRKTWESIPEKYRPLPGRKNVVITRQPDYAIPEGVEVFGSLDDALKAHTQEDIIINGGGEIYRESMSIVDRLEITHIHRDIDGDTSFPVIDPNIWKETNREDHDDYSFVTYDRRAV